MKIVFHFDGSEALAHKVKSLGVELCPESEVERFNALLPQVEVL